VSRLILIGIAFHQGDILIFQMAQNKQFYIEVKKPWRPANGWKTYAQLNSEGNYVLMDKPPVKLKRHLERILQELV